MKDYRCVSAISGIVQSSIGYVANKIPTTGILGVAFGVHLLTSEMISSKFSCGSFSFFSSGLGTFMGSYFFPNKYVTSIVIGSLASTIGEMCGKALENSLVFKNEDHEYLSRKDILRLLVPGFCLSSGTFLLWNGYVNS